MYDKQICSTGFTVLRGIKPNIVSRFIYYLSMSERFIQTLNKLQVGTSYPAVKDDDLFNQAFPLCSTEEQHQIVQEIETRLSVCDNVEANIKESLIKAESLRKSILKKAFEGKLLIEAELEEVKNDPEWEPAEKLLARIEQSRNEKIKAEKTKSSKQKRKKR
jgi:type I restriction enzyme S subunit